MTALADPYVPLSARRVAPALLGAALAIALGLCGVGWLLLQSDFFAPVRAFDDQVSRQVAALRTPAGDELSAWGSTLADTYTCIALAVILLVVLHAWLGRWREPFVILAAIWGEVLIFLAVTALVPRDRPTVEHLDPAPPTSSFPSGHTAAAVALYGCLSVVLVRHLRPTWLAVIVAGACWLVPMAVGVARIYRGMHHLTDVLVGAAIGGVWLMIVLAVMYPLPRLPSSHGMPKGRRDRAEEAVA